MKNGRNRKLMWVTVGLLIGSVLSFVAMRRMVPEPATAPTSTAIEGLERELLGHLERERLDREQFGRTPLLGERLERERLERVLLQLLVLERFEREHQPPAGELEMRSPPSAGSKKEKPGAEGGTPGVTPEK